MAHPRRGRSEIRHALPQDAAQGPGRLQVSEHRPGDCVLRGLERELLALVLAIPDVEGEGQRLHGAVPDLLRNVAQGIAVDPHHRIRIARVGKADLAGETLP